MFSWVAEPGITAFKFLQTSGNMENETLVHFIIVVSLVTCPAQPLSYAHHCNGSAGSRNDLADERWCAFCFSTLSSCMLPLAVWFPCLNSIVMETEKERGGGWKARSTPSLETSNAGLTQNNPPPFCIFLTCPVKQNSPGRVQMDLASAEKRPDKKKRKKGML